MDMLTVPIFKRPKLVIFGVWMFPCVAWLADEDWAVKAFTAGALKGAAKSSIRKMQAKNKAATKALCLPVSRLLHPLALRKLASQPS